jgi:hypothetical protein
LLIIPGCLKFVFNKSIFEVIFDVFELPEFVSREFLQVERGELFIKVYGLDAREQDGKENNAHILTLCSSLQSVTVDLFFAYNLMESETVYYF